MKKRSRKRAAVPDIRKLRPKSSYSADEVKRRIRLLTQDPRQASTLRRAIAITLVAKGRPCETAHEEAIKTCASFRSKGPETWLGFGRFFGLDRDDPEVDVYLDTNLCLHGGIDEDTGRPYLHAASGSYNALQLARRQYDEFIESERRTRRARRKSPATMAA